MAHQHQFASILQETTAFDGYLTKALGVCMALSAHCSRVLHRCVGFGVPQKDTCLIVEFTLASPPDVEV